jgi:hypothetical protein
MRRSELTASKFRETPAWHVVGDPLLDDDPEVAPAPLTSAGTISMGAKEVWCLVQARFADGTLLDGVALCRGDSPEGPLLWQFFGEGELISLFVPPAPDFVLEEDGPEAFARRFSRPVSAIFPLTVVVQARFERAPVRRAVEIAPDGTLTPQRDGAALTS